MRVPGKLWKPVVYLTSSSVLLLQLLESFPSTWRYARLSSPPVPPWLIFPTNFPHRTVTVTCAVYIGRNDAWVLALGAGDRVAARAAGGVSWQTEKDKA